MADVIRHISLREDGSKLSDRMVAELEWRILSGELRSGARLPTEADLCALLGVSRSVVRDATRTLAARGLLEIRHGVGMIVATPSDTHLSHALTILLLRTNLTMGEVLAARAMLETNIGVLAATNSTNQDIQALEAQLGAFRAALEAEDWGQAHAEHMHFHRRLHEAVHLPALAILFKPMQEVILLSSMPPEADNSELWEIPAHEEIVRAVAAHDEPRLRAALDTHFELMAGEPYTRYRATPFRECANVRQIFNRLEERDGERSKQPMGVSRT